MDEVRQPLAEKLRPPAGAAPGWENRLNVWVIGEVSNVHASFKRWNWGRP